MRAFITGVDGFAGRWLARLLKGRSCEVFGIGLSEELKELGDCYWRCDILNFDHLAKILSGVRPDWVFHLAAISSVKVSLEEPERTFKVNGLGTLNLLEAVRRTSPSARVALISSCEVYGAAQGVLKEETPLRPISPYGLSKLWAEEAGRFYTRAYGLWTVILRPFNHTGPGQQEVFVFPEAARQIVEMELGKREPVLWVGNLDARRDFTDVRDMVRAYLLAMEHCEPGEVYNITSGWSYSIREGIEMLCSQARVEVEVRVEPARLRPHDIPILHGDSSKFSSLTGWRPEIRLEKALSDLLDHYRGRG